MLIIRKIASLVAPFLMISPAFGSIKIYPKNYNSAFKITTLLSFSVGNSLPSISYEPSWLLAVSYTHLTLPTN